MAQLNGFRRDSTGRSQFNTHTLVFRDQESDENLHEVSCDAPLPTPRVGERLFFIESRIVEIGDDTELEEVGNHPSLANSRTT